MEDPEAQISRHCLPQWTAFQWNSNAWPMPHPSIPGRSAMAQSAGFEVTEVLRGEP